MDFNIVFILSILAGIIWILIISYYISKFKNNFNYNSIDSNYNSNNTNDINENYKDKIRDIKRILNNYNIEKKNIIEALINMINYPKYDEINLNLILININNLNEIYFKINCIMKYINSYKRLNSNFYLEQALLVNNYNFKQSKFIKFGKFGIPHNKSIMLNDIENELIADKINSLKLDNHFITYQEINIIINTDYKKYLNDLYNNLNKIQQNNHINAIIEEEFNKDIEIAIE